MVIACGRDGRWGYFALGRATFQRRKVAKVLRACGPGPSGRPIGEMFLTSGAQNLTLLPRLPGLPGPGWSKSGTSPPLSFRALVSQLCVVVPGSAAPPSCATLDSVAPRIGRPQRATAVSRTGNRFCSLSWWGYKVSPVKRTKFLSRTGRVSRIGFCKVRPTQGRWPPVTGSGGRPVEAEGTARGRFGLTPAILWFLSDRSERNSPRRAKPYTPINQNLSFSHLQKRGGAYAHYPEPTEH